MDFGVVIDVEEAGFIQKKIKRERKNTAAATAMETEKSRKGANRLLNCLWNYNNHPSVKEFMKKYDLLNGSIKYQIIMRLGRI